MNSPEKEVSISLNVGGITLHVNQKLQLIANVLPVNKYIVWKSNNNNIATVSNSGMVSCIKKGMVFIIASTLDGSNVARCIVNIIN
jgi:uncharacterized protein YjdB